MGIKLRMSSNPDRSRLMTNLVSWMDPLSLGSLWSVSACSACHVMVSVCAHRGQFHHLYDDGVFFNGHSVDTLVLNLVGQTENRLRLRQNLKFLIDPNPRKDLKNFESYMFFVIIVETNPRKLCLLM